MWGNIGRGVDLKANKARLMALAETAAKKAIKSNGETGYDHSLDPQDFPQHEGLARAGYLLPSWHICKAARSISGVSQGDRRGQLGRGSVHMGKQWPWH